MHKTYTEIIDEMPFYDSFFKNLNLGEKLVNLNKFFTRKALTKFKESDTIILRL